MNIQNIDSSEVIYPTKINENFQEVKKEVETLTDWRVEGSILYVPTTAATVSEDGVLTLGAMQL